MNEGLIKAAEEQANGLAKDSPLVATQGGKKNRGGAMRMDTFAKLLEELYDAGEDYFNAGFEIALGWRLRDNPASLRTAQRMWGSVGGMNVQDANEYTQRITDRFDRWVSWTAIRRLINRRQIAIGICAQGQTYSEAGWNHSLDPRTAKKYAIQGVYAYVDSNRKQPEPFRPKIYEPQSRHMNVSRVVHFIEENT